ncbi:NACHT domain-containing protein [Streptomyces sp. GMR22]|uniref:NACHT domain-containing protein n=1 Tax=Streptomyces sp. GMR22 TaxID=2759524 RepID=UPI0015FCD150|nr:NACHT domain-containing protein [Streptomyces sp. GMR22]MBA6438821.1 NACHT domain-containing protein [Streptomyces sp. GMR22]
MSAEAAAINLGRTVATRVVRLWLEPRRREQESRMEMSALVRRRVPGLRAQRGVERQFEQIADAVAARLEPMCGHEFRDLEEGGRQAALDAVTAAFAHADLSDEAILGSDANPAELARRVRASAPPPTGLDEAATRFYELLLAECCDCYVRILQRLPVFTERGITELLGRVGELGPELSRVLERLPVRSLYAPQGADQDAAFRREYLEFLSRTLDEVELFSFTAGQAPRTKLSVAYISLRVSTGGDGRATRRSVGGPDQLLRTGISSWDGPEQESSASVRVEAALKESARILLRGEAGSGKTTLLNWLAVTAARGAFGGDLADWNGLVPVLVKLRRYASRELPRPEELLDAAAGPLTGHMPRAWMDREFQAGRVLLLVDGVDELVAGERRKVREWLRLLLNAYPRTRTMVTSRPTAARGDWLREEGFAPVGLERMTPADLRAFVRQWHQAVGAQGGDLPCALEELPHYERALLAALRDRPHLRTLAASPLLAALLCALHLGRRRRLPRNRMELYRIALELLVQRRDAERGVPSALDVQLSLTDKLCVLRDLAWRLSDNNRNEISTEKALAHVTVKVASMRHLDAEGEAVLDHLVSRSGVLRVPAEDRIDFLHRSFQEYLAAEEAAAEDRIGNLVERAHLDTWRETIIMAAGHANRGQRQELVTGILDRAEAERRHARGLRLLAASCLETMESVQEGLAARLDENLRVLVPPRRRKDAVSLAAVGDPVLRRLPRSLDGLTDAAARAAVRTAALIGGERALDVLDAYAAAERDGAHQELADAWEYFDPDEYAQRVLAKFPLERVTLKLSHPSQWAAARKLRSVRKILISHPLTSGLATLTDLPGLSSLWISRLVRDNDLSPLAAHPRLSTLSIIGNTALEDVSPLSALTDLQELGLTGWSSLPPVSEIPMPGTLATLNLGNLPHDPDLVFLRDLPSLDKLYLAGSGTPRNLASLSAATIFKRLWLGGFDFTTSLPVLSASLRIPDLSFYDCAFPTDLSPLNAVPSLEIVFFGACQGPDPGPLDLSSLAGRTAPTRLTVLVGRTQAVTGTEHLGPGIRVRYL